MSAFGGKADVNNAENTELSPVLLPFPDGFSRCSVDWTSNQCVAAQVNLEARAVCHW